MAVIAVFRLGRAGSRRGIDRRRRGHPSAKVKVVQHLEGGIIEQPTWSRARPSAGPGAGQLALAPSARAGGCRCSSTCCRRARLKAEIDGTTLAFPPEVGRAGPSW
jgi:hypothetical protein